MAKRIRLTRLELKRQRDALTRYLRFLPTLKLKQQQLQMAVRQCLEEVARQEQALRQSRERLERYEAILGDRAGLDVRKAAEPAEVRTDLANTAGVSFPVFREAVFPEAGYSLFATPAWVDRTLQDLRALAADRARQEVLQRQRQLLERELTRVTQRVNLFEKIKIPETREAIRRIRIQLGDEMTAAVVRAKIAKVKISEKEHWHPPVRGSEGGLP